MYLDFYDLILRLHKSVSLYFRNISFSASTAAIIIHHML